MRRFTNNPYPSWTDVIYNDEFTKCVLSEDVAFIKELISEDFFQKAAKNVCILTTTFEQALIRYVWWAVSVYVRARVVYACGVCVRVRVGCVGGRALQERQ